jgi:tetratricopeptide (TPR) repeat protein
MPLLFRRKPEIYWKGAIHNHLNADVGIDSDIVLLSGHSPAHANDPDRAMRILKKEVEKNPELCREVFYLAREYRYRGDWITALYWYEVYLTRAKWGPEIAEAYLQMARCYWELGRGDEARIACAMALKDSGDFREALEFMARLSGPIGREQWLKYAALARNRNVLFVRPSSHERDAEYYDRVFAEGYDTSRYDAIYHQVGRWCEGKRVLDIGCGTGPLQKYIKDYRGFDFSKKGIETARNPNLWVGNAYDEKNYAGNYDVYVALETLEHLDDIKVIRNIPAGKPFIFSVPSFLDPGHVRCYTEAIVRERFNKLLDIKEIIRFNATGDHWSQTGPETENHILLVKSVRLSEVS